MTDQVLLGQIEDEDITAKYSFPWTPHNLKLPLPVSTCPFASMPGHETTERARLRNGGARVLASDAENLPTASSPLSFPLSFFHSFQFLGWAEAGRKATPGVLTGVQFGISAPRRDRLSLMFQGSCSLGAPTHLSPVPPKPLVGKLSLRAPWSPQEPDTGFCTPEGDRALFWGFEALGC